MIVCQLALFDYLCLPICQAMALEIREVTTRGELKKFIQFGIDLFDGDSSYCPPLWLDEWNTLRRDINPAFEVCESVYYLAWREGKIVGRIAGILNKRANEHWNVKKIRFGWFDFIDDMEVSKALLDAVASWGKAKGMDTLNGPVGFTDMDHQGLLIEGYQYLSPMAALYNYPYYVKHYEAYGLQKEADWIEIRLTNPQESPDKAIRLSEAIKSRYHIKVEKIRSARTLLKRFRYEFFNVIDGAYAQLYNYSPLTERQKQNYTSQYLPLINYDFVTLITNEQGELVGVGICMPNITHALRRCKGRLLPWGWLHLLRALKAKKIDEVDLLLIAVRPDYQNKGVTGLIFVDQAPAFKKYDVKYANVTAIWEENLKNQSNWLNFEHEVHKRRRAYIKPL